MTKIIFGIILIAFLSCQKIEEIPDIKNAKKNELLDLVNQIRNNGCNCANKFFGKTESVEWNTTLEKIALAHSFDMFTKKYFSHVSPDGSNPLTRITNSGYIWKTFGENIFMAQGFNPSEKEVIEAWKNSPSHCENLMNPNFKEMGIGSNENYWTQVFASK